MCILMVRNKYDYYYRQNDNEMVNWCETPIHI